MNVIDGGAIALTRRYTNLTTEDLQQVHQAFRCFLLESLTGF
jgi:hypothetical protein